jgi:Peptidase A4 family
VFASETGVKAITVRVVTVLVVSFLAGCGTTSVLERPQAASSPTVVTPPPLVEPTASPIPARVAAAPALGPQATPRVAPMAEIRPVPSPVALVRPPATRLPAPAPPATAVRPPVAVTRRTASTSFAPNRMGSGNWSGYMASGTFWSVSGSWTEPSVTCTTPSSTAAFWVGLGGGSSYPLYQVGSGVLCQNGSPVHILWYELLTATSQPPQTIVRQISAGDAVSVTVDLRGSGRGGRVDLVDRTASWSTQVGFTPQSTSLGTVEWVAEATTSTSSGAVSPLADFGSIVYQSCSANGGQASLSGLPNAQLTQVTLHDAHGGMATPGPVAAQGGGFTVTYGR